MGPRGVRPTVRTSGPIEFCAAAIVAVVYLFSSRPSPSPELVGRAESNARWIVEFQRRLGLDVEQGVQEWALRLDLAGAVNWAYGSLHFVVTAATLVYLFRWRRADYTRWRTAFVVSSVSAFLIYLVLPVAPPRLLRDANGEPFLVDTLAQHSGPWSFDSGPISEVANHYAAVPSMHAGWALFCALALGLGRPLRQRILLLGYPLLVTFVIMASGNHFLIDALAGFAVVLAGLAVTRRLSRPSVGDLSVGDQPLLDHSMSNNGPGSRTPSTHASAAGARRSVAASLDRPA